MAYIDFVPTVTSSTTGWTQLSNAIDVDSAYAINASGNTTYLYLDAFTSNPSSLIPVDSKITGIEVFYTARVSGGTGGFLDFNYYIENTRTPVASSIRSAVLSNTDVTSSVGGSSNKFEFDLQWIDLNQFDNRRQKVNPWFGVSVKSASATVPIWIDNVSIRVHYTSYAYLVGSRTKFHLGREDLGYDVDMSNDIALPSSYIPKKDNGIANINQVTAHDVNLLGDSLYSIESAVLAASGKVHAIDLKKTYVFAITVSAYCDGANVLTDALVYAKIRNAGSTFTNTLNVYSPIKSVAPHVSGTIMCHWTSAIGWVESAAGTRPVYVNAQGARFQKVTNGIDFVVGVSAIASSIGIAEDYDTYEGSVGAYQGYIGSWFNTEATSGKLHIKVLAIGREV